MAADVVSGLLSIAMTVLTAAVTAMYCSLTCSDVSECSARGTGPNHDCKALGKGKELHAVAVNGARDSENFDDVRHQTLASLESSLQMMRLAYRKRILTLSVRRGRS